MIVRSRLLLPVVAIALAFACAVPAAFADDMSKDSMSKDTGMKKDSMSKDKMSKDNMSRTRCRRTRCRRTRCRRTRCRSNHIPLGCAGLALRGPVRRVSQGARLRNLR